MTSFVLKIPPLSASTVKDIKPALKMHKTRAVCSRPHDWNLGARIKKPRWNYLDKLRGWLTVGVPHEDDLGFPLSPRGILSHELTAGRRLKEPVVLFTRHPR